MKKNYSHVIWISKSTNWIITRGELLIEDDSMYSQVKLFYNLKNASIMSVESTRFSSFVSTLAIEMHPLIHGSWGIRYDVRRSSLYQEKITRSYRMQSHAPEYESNYIQELMYSTSHFWLKMRIENLPNETRIKSQLIL